jgi:pyrroloquinoline quinone biosynthesis protein D
MTPRLRRGARLSYDEVRGRHVLLVPEGVLVLNETAFAVLTCFDGKTPIEDFADRLGEEFDGVRPADVEETVQWLVRRGVVELDG